jgi:hypothetical protein
VHVEVLRHQGRVEQPAVVAQRATRGDAPGGRGSQW